MNFPKGTIWQDLRTRCLDVIPAGSSAPFTAPRPLNAWRKDGYYTVSCTAKDTITVLASGDDFGTALLSDVEHLLDHAAEHHSALYRAVKSDQWLSPAWTVVTIYYWGFFCTLALTRLLGRTSWYLDKEAADDFRRLSNHSSNVGAGAYRVECKDYVSATNREIKLHKAKDRIHESVWKNATKSLEAVARNNTTNPDELFFYNAIIETASILQPDWPSTLRNTVNYRPGVGYREVLGDRPIDIVQHLRKFRKIPIVGIADAVRFQLSNIDPAQDFAVQPAAVSRLLFHFTLLLQVLATNLHEELVSRHSLDKRWSDKRRHFLKRQGLEDTGFPWP